MKKLDVLFVNTNTSDINYQELSKKFAAIETPIWAGMLANSCRNNGFSAVILDCEAEQLDTLDSAKEIINADAKLVVLIAQGQNPNDSTPKMEGLSAVSRKVKEFDPKQKILFVGPHIAALPRETLATEEAADFIAQNEGVYTILNLLKVQDLNDEQQLLKVKGLGFRTKNFQKSSLNKSLLSVVSEENLSNDPSIVLNEPEQIVPRALLEKDLPGVAWDLLPSPSKYRTSGWHSWSNNTEQSPFASIYTSLGCPHKCHFCMINVLNRTNNTPGIVASDSNVFRYWDPKFMIKHFDKLAEMGVKNIKIADELFVLNKNHFLPLCEMIIERKYDFNIWTYSRIDSCKPEYLDTLKKAGVNWLALGIENPNQTLRREFVKGGFEEVKITDLMKDIHNAGINIIGNYIFGLPPDTKESMKETLEFAKQNLTEEFNIYPAQALPGSPLYNQARKEGWKLPDRYAGYSMLSYWTENCSNNNLTAAEILKARDESYLEYHQNPEYLKLLENKFGIKARNFVEENTKIKLKRKILGD